MEFPGDFTNPQQYTKLEREFVCGACSRPGTSFFRPLYRISNREGNKILELYKDGSHLVWPADGPLLEEDITDHNNAVGISSSESEADTTAESEAESAKPEDELDETINEGVIH